MYFSDAHQKLQEGNIPTRLFLSGSNEFMKEFIVEKLAHLWGRVPERVLETKVLMAGESLFDTMPKFYVLAPKCEPKRLEDFMVKLATSRMNAKYKKTNFLEIICNDLFPNQVEQFCSRLFVNFPIATIRKICYYNNYDIYSIYNTHKIYSYYPDGLQSYCGNLSSAELLKVADHFIDGNYPEFLRGVYDGEFKPGDLLWTLSGLVTKVWLSYSKGKNKTWYEKKLYRAGARLDPAGFNIIISFLSGLASSYKYSRDQIVLNMCNLVSYLNGESISLIGG
jgi:hypothetical protein